VLPFAIGRGLLAEYQAYQIFLRVTPVEATGARDRNAIGNYPPTALV